MPRAQRPGPTSRWVRATLRPELLAAKQRDCPLRSCLNSSSPSSCLCVLHCPSLHLSEAKLPRSAMQPARVQGGVCGLGSACRAGAGPWSSGLLATGPAGRRQRRGGRRLAAGRPTCEDPSRLPAASSCCWLWLAGACCASLHDSDWAARRTPHADRHRPVTSQPAGRQPRPVDCHRLHPFYTGMMVSSLYVVLAAAATTLTGATSVTVTVNPKNITHKVNPFFNGCHSDSVRKAQATQYHPKRPSPHLAHCCFFIGRKHAHTRRPNS